LNRNRLFRSLSGVNHLASRNILNKTVCVVGWGIGLPLVEAFSRHIRMIGCRRDKNKVDELNTMPGNKIEAIADPAKIRNADFVIR
jgi:UDPglucose 6-dehydrogenase/UDP-N-acetyl-D-galactosamine dehydrogenase